MKTVADRGQAAAPPAGRGPDSGVRAPGSVGIDRRKRRQLVGAAAVFAVGVAATAGSVDLGYWSRGPGPGFFPLWAGIVLVVLSLVWGIQTVRGVGVPEQEESVEGGVRHVVLVLLGLGALVLLLDVLGYQLAMFLFVLYVLMVVGRRRWLESLVFAAFAGFGVYTLFANVLQVYLPTASLGFLTGLGL
jgi:putative tricarboxylic transport membrane protein